jgi:hypothetical protein
MGRTCNPRVRATRIALATFAYASEWKRLFRLLRYAAISDIDETHAQGQTIDMVF